jgi:L-alanine-DL-glutamate epimerase-like enolase superfamily enzyme
MTQIARVRTRVIGFSQTPSTLRRNLVTNASVFEDFETKSGGWFGPAFCTLVEVETADGHTGAGTAGAFNGAAKSVVDMYLVDLLRGQDLENHEGIWQRMYRTLVRFGRRGSAISALSAVDIALWDADGIRQSRPTSELLGGITQSHVPCYVSRLYALEDLDALGDEARGYVAEGFQGLKQRFGFGPKDGYEGMAANVRLVKAVREAVGDDVELAADAYMGWDYGYALQMAKRLEPFNLSWIEEPLMPEQLDRYAALKAAVPWQRWSAGEHSYTKWDFHELIQQRAVDILQPDFNRAGGLTEARKICALAETAGLPVMPHSNEGHNLAVVFSQPPHVCPMAEYFPNVEPDTGNELFWSLFEGNRTARMGNLSVSPAPGLGVTVNQDRAAELTVIDGDWLSLE